MVFLVVKSVVEVKVGVVGQAPLHGNCIARAGKNGQELGSGGRLK